MSSLLSKRLHCLCVIEEYIFTFKIFNVHNKNNYQEGPVLRYMLFSNILHSLENIISADVRNCSSLQKTKGWSHLNIITLSQIFTLNIYGFGF